MPMKSSPIPLKPIGIWTGAFEQQPAAKVYEAVAELEELGFGAIWYSEGLGREALTQASLLLSATSRIVVATGIANIYARDPFTMAAGQKTLSEAYRLERPGERVSSCGSTPFRVHRCLPDASEEYGTNSVVRGIVHEVLVG